ncbi:hypothetical protein C6N75_24470 [Streptomyces solincola]|uniref:Uncharacterized protein n=1 Tax=Streptomyces solincola TaxID=2100817 RepID=A0A2S9PQH1_9ACTN|nr:hypothetical protein [Streptomyces solincola]PRH76651.1 hypothetical protein C6N75_24470 [Streptomyces solincola]
MFAAALRRRDLPLERVRDRLRARGISVGLATLSYWRSGRSQPERPESLRAVDALEPLLGLPAGTLSSLLASRRPRGRAARYDPEVGRRVYADDPYLREALGDERFAHFNEGLQSTVIHTTVTLNRHRAVCELATTHVVRARRNGVSELTVVVAMDDLELPDGGVAFEVRYGESARVTRLPELGCLTADILFGRTLARNETAVVDYTVRMAGATTPSHSYERRVPAALRAFLLHIRFDPGALPAVCHPYFREHVGAQARRGARLVLDASHTAHLVPARCAPGVHGVHWEWPRDDDGKSADFGSGAAD